MPCQGIWGGNILVTILKKNSKQPFSEIFTMCDLNSIHIVLLNIYEEGIISLIQQIRNWGSQTSVKVAQQISLNPSSLRNKMKKIIPASQFDTKRGKLNNTCKSVYHRVEHILCIQEILVPSPLCRHKYLPREIIPVC